MSFQRVVLRALMASRAQQQHHLLSSRQLPLLAVPRRHFATAGNGGAKQEKAGEEKKQEGKDGKEDKEKSGEEEAAEENPYDAGPQVSRAQVVAGISILVGLTVGFAYGAYIVAKAVPTEEQIKESKETGQDVSFWGNIRTLVYGLQPILPREMPDALGRRPRTLVLGWDKVLVHCEWSRQDGWKVRKRPGVDKFLERCQRAGFEVVLWANMAAFEIEALVAELDRTGAFKHKLFNEQASFKWVAEQEAKDKAKELAQNTQIAAEHVGAKVDAPPAAGKRKGGFQLVRDLSRLQRDPKRLLVLDTKNAPYAPVEDKTNVLFVEPFEEQTEDPTLKQLGDIIENIQRYNIHDVSTVVARYNANPSADLFVRERAAEQAAMRKLRRVMPAGQHGKAAHAAAASDDEEDDEDDEEEHKSKSSGGGWMGRLRGMVGGKAQPAK